MIHIFYIKKFINIEPSKSEIINFIINLKRKSEKKLIITTGKNTPNILKEISHLTKELDFQIYENLSFNELETITMKSKIEKLFSEIEIIKKNIFKEYEKLRKKYDFDLIK